VQVARYSFQLAAVKGIMSHAVHVVLGDGRRQTVATAHAGAFVRRLRAQHLAFVEGTHFPVDDGADPAYPWRVFTCRCCAWNTQCDDRRDTDDHLTLVPGMRKHVAAKLFATTFGTCRKLAMIAPTHVEALSRTIRVPAPTFDRFAMGARRSV
jgi:uncharacterized protein